MAAREKGLFIWIPEMQAELLLSPHSMGEEQEHKGDTQREQTKEDRNPEQLDLALMFRLGRSNPNYIMESPHRFKQRFERCHSAQGLGRRSKA